MTPNITTGELDLIARLGFEDLKAAFAPNAPGGTLERAELTLKLIRQGTSRMSGENNRVATVVKVGRAAGLKPEEYRPLWEQIIGRPAVALTAGGETPEKSE